DRNTVQGAIEQGLNYTLRPVYAANLITSSRTDTGVSATAATAALDLVHRHVDRGIYFDPRAITHKRGIAHQVQLCSRVLTPQLDPNNIGMPEATGAGRNGPASSGGIRLVRFNVYNSSFGPKEEDQFKKIIYYYPEDETEDDQCRHVGLSEAHINFTDVFFPEATGRVLHAQRYRTVFYAAEDGYWLSLAVSVPFTRRPSTKNGLDCNEYRPDDVHSRVLLAQLKHTYDMFRFFMGGFDAVMMSCSEDVVFFKERCRTFFSKFVPTLKPGQADILDEFQAVQFLSLEPKAFLQVKGFVKQIQDEFASVEQVVFFQQGNLVWSDLQQDDTQLLYHYITSTLLPHAPTHATPNTLEGEGTPRSPFSGHQGRFLSGGPPNPNSSTFEEPLVVKVHLQRDQARQEHHLIVYHALNSTVCLMIPSFQELTHELYRKLDASLGPQMTHMSADLMDVFSHASKPAAIHPLLSPVSTPLEPSLAVKFVYFNKFNRAMKSTLHIPSPNLQEDPLLQSELKKVILDLSDLIGSANDRALGMPLEYYVKMSSDQWVIGKAADQRQVYIVITAKCANLMDASEEVGRMILKTLAVRGSFYVQKVKSRRYVYRFLVENGKHPDILSEFSHSWSPRDSAKILIHGTSTGTSKRPRTTPIVAAWAKSLGFVEIRPPFDVDRFQSALSLFKGTHNFGSFTTGLALKNLFKTKGQDGVLAYIVRDVDDIQVHRMPMDAVEDLMPVAKCFDFYHVHINSTGFLHNQVRRMLGAAFRVAGHGIELSNIQQMLDEPSPGNFVNCKPMQAEGLHLTEINYDPDDLIGATDRFQDLPLSSPVGTPKVLQPIDWSSVSLLPPDRQQAQDIVNTMSFLTKLQERRLALSHAKTRVRTANGTVWVEEYQKDTGETSRQVVDRVVPFVVDLQPDLQVAEITPFLYLGSQDVAGDLPTLQSNRITHILNVGSGIPNSFPVDFHYFNEEILDVPEFDIQKALARTFNIIDQVRRLEGRLFVHCNAGISRAPSVVIAYIMQYQNMPFSQALVMVQQRRSAVKPNEGFTRQLQAFDCIE
ncbi:hypothetical protein TCAL_07067, partial [Tigriopus californicus]